MIDGPLVRRSRDILATVHERTALCEKSVAWSMRGLHSPQTVQLLLRGSIQRKKPPSI